MSIARAFTTRKVKQSLELRDAAEGIPARSNTTRAGGLKASVSIRNKISGPVELVHTTNMLSYNAPDLFPKTTPSSASSRSTDEDSDATMHTAASTPPTSPDSPFPDKRSMSPEPNHLSCYFTPPAQATANAPAIPQRSPSHTKKHSEGLARQRSISRMSDLSGRSHSTKASFSFSRSSSSSTTTSTTSSVSQAASPLHPPKVQMAPLASPPSVVSNPPVSAAHHHKKEYSDSHPFGHELAQVSELAEEYAVAATSSHAANRHRLPTVDEEEQELLQKGLRKFTANDYLSEIQHAFNTFFAEDEPQQQPVAALWI
ncbi:uncharacterized protein E0L32_007840 [Thyridium curvatum]|uniref:Uncharacterized protein n=1 Tax=Thyridium curvatum TaxID=1093900 RepID=A0A507B2X6_9PEZI|nr:uncharacterized protein E0L32_007840 [Thyridium curvatum]TPX11421.1 hypothetical protein E0L32_007840 [Thyridium curvatum]